MHETGEGGAQNPKKAFQYFNIACDAGFGMACTHIGSMYQQGNGVEQSQAKAAKYFKSSCDKGEFTGCALLGNLNYNMQNYYEAKKYFGKACELGKKNTPSDPNLKGAWSVLAICMKG